MLLRDKLPKCYWGHGRVGALAYALVVVVANLDKGFVELLTLSARQAFLMFFVTAVSVGMVERYWRQPTWFRTALVGVGAPAVAVTVASALAHWFFTNEWRNVLVPLLVSVSSNTLLVIALAHGHSRLSKQASFYLEMLPGFCEDVKTSLRELK